MKWVIELVAKIFGELFGTMMEHPYEVKEGVRDVGRAQPDNPDDAFCPADW